MDDMLKISDNVTYRDVTKSTTATKYNISNTPNNEQLENIRFLCNGIIEVLIKKGFKFNINSFFRSLELNKKIGGATKSISQHCKGEAVDLSSVDSISMFNFIKENLEFDQLIYEFGNEHQPQWVHVSLKKENNRKQILKSIKENGKTKYLPYV
jgi:hypothetical protein